MKFDFPETPGGSLPELWRAVLRLLPQLGGAGSTVRGAYISTSETPVAHGMRFAPAVGIPVATANVAIWETRAPDAKYGYFAAASATTASVRVVP